MMNDEDQLLCIGVCGMHPRLENVLVRLFENGLENPARSKDATDTQIE